MRTSQVLPKGPGRDFSSGWWVRGLGGTSKLAGNDADSGARVPSTGFVVGLDGAINSHFFLGASGGRTTPHVMQEDDMADTTSRMLSFGLYARYRQGASRLDAGVAGRQPGLPHAPHRHRRGEHFHCQRRLLGTRRPVENRYRITISARRTISVEPVAGLDCRTTQAGRCNGDRRGSDQSRRARAPGHHGTLKPRRPHREGVRAVVGLRDTA